jgi:(p)ppGpp synthase/HD superfamily hydrolase
MSVSFSLNPIESEVADKISSMIQYSDASERGLLELSATKFSAGAWQQIEATISFAKSLKSEDPNHPSMRVYFSHPVRVATLALRLGSEPDLENVKTGLLHNVFEVSGVREDDLLQAGFSDRMARGIRLLTVDRKRQYDADYLTGFYHGIEAFGEDLALIKCVDKLDNLLGLEVFERTPQIQTYLDLCERFVVPMAQRLSPEFGYYVRDVVAYMQASNGKQDLRAQYEFFVAQDANELVKGRS